MGTDGDGMRPFVVTGCGRSGTKYTAKLLSAAGIRCSHERLFTGRRADNIDCSIPISDSSWMAAPFLEKLPPGAVVLHQTRDPLAVVSSHVARGFFDTPAIEHPWWKHILKRALGKAPSGQYRLVALVREALPGVFRERTPIQRAARFWIEWNSLVETHSELLRLERVVYRVEDLEAALLRSLARRITGTDLSAAAAQAAIATIPTNTNTGPSSAAVSLRDLGHLQDQFVAKAGSYGYELREGHPLT